MYETPTSASESSPEQQTVDRPTRGSDRNRDPFDRTDPATHDALLPSLKNGITLLDIEEMRGVSVLQSLVLDHLLMHEGPAFWIDANGHATTTTFARLAPSKRLLDRIHVARGFTAYQHYAAVCDLPTAVDRHIQQTTTGAGTMCRQPSTRGGESPPQTPSLVVAPAVDAQYRADDTLETSHTETLQTRTLARLTAYAEGYDVPVLVTRSERDEFTAPVETAADHHLECEHTQFGPRFVGEGFETLVYPVADGAYYQTTLAYWRQLLDARAKQVGLEPTRLSDPTDGTSEVGTSVTTDGETATLTADPLLDAWTTTASLGR